MTPRTQKQHASMWRGFGDAWTAVSYILSGIVIWGGLGMLADRALGSSPALTIVGTIAGNFGGIYLIYIRMGGGDGDRAR